MISAPAPPFGILGNKAASFALCSKTQAPGQLVQPALQRLLEKTAALVILGPTRHATTEQITLIFGNFQRVCKKAPLAIGPLRLT